MEAELNTYDSNSQVRGKGSPGKSYMTCMSLSKESYLEISFMKRDIFNKRLESNSS